jgi:NitT/TauT family transport system ATP-binding protein
MTERITAGFIPLVDASSLLVAQDFGFAEAEGLHIELVREVSWANVREKLSVGLFDVAHLLAPMALASRLGIVPGAVPLTAHFVLALNGNAITVSLPLHRDIAGELRDAGRSPADTARALKRVVERRREAGKDLLTFGTTFPFSCHTYLLHHWMASAGIDPLDDVRIVVLPPPAMAEYLASGEVDGFCVGAPWNSAAVEAGTGAILHFGCEIASPLVEKVLATREAFAHDRPDVLIRLMRALSNAADFLVDPANRAICCRKLSAPNRIGAEPFLIERALSGSLKLTLEDKIREDSRYLLLGSHALARPDHGQAEWLYAQMVRWGHVALSPALSAAANASFSSSLFDQAFTSGGTLESSGTAFSTFLGARPE